MIKVVIRLNTWLGHQSLCRGWSSSFVIKLEWGQRIGVKLACQGDKDNTSEWVVNDVHHDYMFFIFFISEAIFGTKWIYERTASTYRLMWRCPHRARQKISAGDFVRASIQKYYFCLRGQMKYLGCLVIKYILMQPDRSSVVEEGERKAN